MKKTKFLILTLLYVSFANAQDLANGITTATAQLTSIVAPLKTFFYVLAAIVALYGAFRVYSKHQNGDQDTNKAMGQWAFAFIFLMSAGYIISAVFGV